MATLREKLNSESDDVKEVACVAAMEATGVKVSVIVDAALRLAEFTHLMLSDVGVNVPDDPAELLAGDGLLGYYASFRVALANIKRKAGEA